MQPNFEWDTTKQAKNLAKHGIDFADIPANWDFRLEIGPTPRGNEMRWHALIDLDGIVVAVIYTLRGKTIRIISVRKARDDERKIYRKLAGET